MSKPKWNSPLLRWEENNQDPNIAFTLVARNERARKMWADPHNSSRYMPASFTRAERRDHFVRQFSPDLRGPGEDDKQSRHEKEKDTEPALRFLFNDWPKDLAKGFVLGSSDEICDALVSDPGGHISEQMLAFTFNKHHELVMNVTSDRFTYVKYKGQKEAEQKSFSWIFPLGQRKISVDAAGVLEFVIVLPKYGINQGRFHNNCESFLSSAANGDLLADGIRTDSTAITLQASIMSGSQGWFYLRGKILGSGAYGYVHKVLRMPDGKIFAAKRFRYRESFRQEVDMLKRVCQTYHKNIIQFIEEWHGDYKPLLIMEYVAGGNLLQQMIGGMRCSEIANLAYQTLSALVFLHDQGVMHRDIKPANILCMTPDHYKLADFGVSKEVASLLSKQGTAEYMAPEVHDPGLYSYPADMWSLGVVLFECMDALPNGTAGMNGRQWCEKVLNRCLRYYQRCERMDAGDALDLIIFITNSMLQMDPDKRLSARKCLDEHQYLWDGLAHIEDRDVGSGANSPIQTHPNRSFPPNSVDDSEGDELGEETSSTARWNSGGTPGEGSEPQDFRNEDRTIVANKGKARVSSPPGSFSRYPPSNGGGKIYDPSHIFPWPPSSAGGTLYDPGRVITGTPSMSETGAHTPSTSDASIKRRRDSSDASAKYVEEDGSVTPGRRAPYHPGNEVAAPGLGYFPVNHWVRSRVSNGKRIRSSVSEPPNSNAR